MHRRLHKKSILIKTAQVASSLLFSKFLGIAREILQVKYLGVGALSDAFNIAYKIPNMLRKVFAEGALSAAFIPTLVKIMRNEGEQEASKLITLTHIVIGSILFALCLIVAFFPQYIIMVFAPGFFHKTIECNMAVNLVRILIFFIMFIFSGALLAGAMQAKHHFAIPSWGPAILNVVYLLGLLIGIYYGLTIEHFAYFLVLGGLLQLVVYLYVYFKLQFTFLWPDAISRAYFKEVMIKFLPAVVSVSAIEINLLIDARFASNLPAGSVTLLNISSRFMSIALGAFAVAFSSILLPHFSRISTYAPKRLSFYLLESAKLIMWITIPVMILMSFFSYDIFYTAFYKLAGNFTLEQVLQGATLLQAFLLGLFFFSFNKAILSIYYSLHETLVPTVITFIGSVLNFLLNRLLIPYYGVLGIALATSISAAVQTILFVLILHRKFSFTLYTKDFFIFLVYYMLQVMLVGIPFYGMYHAISCTIKYFLPQYTEFLLSNIGLGLWVAPLCGAYFGVLFLLRKKFNVKTHFLS